MPRLIVTEFVGILVGGVPDGMALSQQILIDGEPAAPFSNRAHAISIEADGPFEVNLGGMLTQVSPGETKWFSVTSRTALVGRLRTDVSAQILGVLEQSLAALASFSKPEVISGMVRDLREATLAAKTQANESTRLLAEATDARAEMAELSKSLTETKAKLNDQAKALGVAQEELESEQKTLSARQAQLAADRQRLADDQEDLESSLAAHKRELDLTAEGALRELNGLKAAAAKAKTQAEESLTASETLRAEYAGKLADLDKLASRLRA